MQELIISQVCHRKRKNEHGYEVTDKQNKAGTYILLKHKQNWSRVEWCHLDYWIVHHELLVNVFFLKYGRRAVIY
jgi:hypothetical protein